MEQQTKLAFAYLRVSGKGQIDGDGFPRQLAAIEGYAKANGLTLARVFREQGISGTKELENRPALQQLLAAVDSRNVPVVLIEKLDRLARDLMIQETILRDLQRRGVTLVSTMEPDLCSDDPSRKLVRQIMGCIAEYEKSMIVSKLAGARQRMRARTALVKAGSLMASAKASGEPLIAFCRADRQERQWTRLRRH